MSYVGVFVGGVGGEGDIPSMRAFRALMTVSGVASVLSRGRSVGVSSPALRDLWAISINWGRNFFGGCLMTPLSWPLQGGAVSMGLALNFPVGDVCSSQSLANF